MRTGDESNVEKHVSIPFPLSFFIGGKTYLSKIIKIGTGDERNWKKKNKYCLSGTLRQLNKIINQLKVINRLNKLSFRFIRTFYF